MEVVDKVRNARERYVLTVFLDITGAFFNAWWPKIINHLHNFGIIGNEIDVKDIILRKCIPFLDLER